MNKQQLVDEIVDYMERYCKVDKPLLSGGCVYWAYVTVGILRAHGYNALLQAGSLCWPRVRPDQDDGVMSTHFTYLFDYPDFSTPLALVNNGVLPEMHCWAAIINSSEIVDVTTRYLIEMCQSTLSLDWPNEAPPPFVWEPLGALNSREIFYEASLDAIKIASLCLIKSLSETFRIDRPPLECPLIFVQETN